MKLNHSATPPLAGCSTLAAQLCSLAKESPNPFPRTVPNTLRLGHLGSIHPKEVEKNPHRPDYVIRNLQIQMLAR